MPLYRAMDRVVCTPAGDTPPSLGREPPESDDAMRARRSGKSPDVPFEVTGDKRTGTHWTWILGPLVFSSKH
jgi:hypothetical protein